MSRSGRAQRRSVPLQTPERMGKALSVGRLGHAFKRPCAPPSCAWCSTTVPHRDRQGSFKL